MPYLAHLKLTLSPEAAAKKEVVGTNQPHVGSTDLEALPQIVFVIIRIANFYATV